MPAPRPLPVTTPAASTTTSTTTDSNFSSTGFFVMTHTNNLEKLLINMTHQSDISYVT